MKAATQTHPELYRLGRFDIRSAKRAEAGKEAMKSATPVTKIASNIGGAVASLAAAPLGAGYGIVLNALDSVNTSRHGEIAADGKSFVMQGSRLEKTAALIGGAALIGLAGAMAYNVTFFLMDNAWIGASAAMQVGAGIGVLALGVATSIRGAWRGAINGVKSAFGLARVGGHKVEESVKGVLENPKKLRETLQVSDH